MQLNEKWSFEGAERPKFKFLDSGSAPRSVKQDGLP